MGILSVPLISMLLECLRHRAPALRSLTVSPSHYWGYADPHPLALISQLSQLTCLRLSSWECEDKDCAAFRHLRGLGNLQVFSSLPPSPLLLSEDSRDMELPSPSCREAAPAPPMDRDDEGCPKLLEDP